MNRIIGGVFNDINRYNGSLPNSTNLFAKYCNCKTSTKYSPVKFANFVYFCITNGKALPLCGNVATLFPA